jgi:hypothetical protein
MFLKVLEMCQVDTYIFFPFNIYSQLLSLYVNNTAQKPAMDRAHLIDDAYIVGRSVEAVVHAINLALCVHRYVKQSQAAVQKTLILTASCFLINAIILIIHRRKWVDNSFYVLHAVIFYGSALMYLYPVIYRLKYFAFYYKHYRRIQILWASIASVFSVTCPALDIISEYQQGTLFFAFYVVMMLGLLQYAVINLHIDYLIAKCVLSTSIQMVSDHDKGTLAMAGQTLVRYLKGSLAWTVVGILTYAAYALLSDNDWFPIPVIYITSIIAYSAQGAHFTCELLFQMNLTEILNVTKNMSSLDSSLKTIT